jgi:WD40 repeat protein
MRVSVGDDVIYQVAWMQDSKRFVTVSADSRCRVIDAETGKPSLVYEGHSRAVLGVDLIEDSALAITGGVDQTLRLWEIENGNVLRTLNNHLDTIHSVFAVPGMGSPHPIMATLGADKTVRLWQPTIGRMMRFARLEAEPLSGVASADGTRVYIGCQDGHVRTIAVDKMNVVSDRVTKLEVIYGMMITPDKKQIFVSGVGGIDWFRIDKE